MKKRQNVSIYLSMLIGGFLMIISSCKKDEKKNNGDLGTYTDFRDGYVYRIVNIGDQV